MLKKHTFSPNHKIVAGPHNYSASGGSPGPAPLNMRGSSMHQPSAEPAGGGAQGPAPQMFSDGGQPDIMGNGIRGTLSDYGNAIKQTASDAVSAVKSKIKANPDDDNDPTGAGGAARTQSTMKQVDDMS